MVLLKKLKDIGTIFTILLFQAILILTISTLANLMSDFWFSNLARQDELVNIFHIRKLGALGVGVVFFIVLSQVWKKADWPSLGVISLMIAGASLWIFSEGYAINFICGFIMILLIIIAHVLVVKVWNHSTGKERAAQNSRFFNWLIALAIFQTIASFILLAAEYEQNKYKNIASIAKSQNRVAYSLEELFTDDKKNVVILKEGSFHISSEFSRSFGSGDDKYTLRIRAIYPPNIETTQPLQNYVWAYCTPVCPKAKEFPAEVWQVNHAKQKDFLQVIDYALKDKELRHLSKGSPGFNGSHIMLDPRPELLFTKAEWSHRKDFRRKAILILAIGTAIFTGIAMLIQNRNENQSG